MFELQRIGYGLADSFPLLGREPYRGKPESLPWRHHHEGRSIFRRSLGDVPAQSYRLTFNGKQYSLSLLIRSFRCSDTALLFRRETVRRFKAIERQALRKLDLLDAATDLRTLSTLPGNRLEALKGERKGQYSIRINDQWRICFEWREGNAYAVEIVDYH